MRAEQAVVQALQESASVRWFDRGIGALQRIAVSARAAHVSDLVQGARTRARVPWETQFGVIVLVAVATHLGLMIANGREPGWVWLLLPAIGGCAGVLLLAVGAARRQERRSRA